VVPGDVIARRAITSPLTTESPMPHFKYTQPKHTYYRIEVDADTFVEVVGDGPNASYEWQIRRGQQIEAHSDAGYGSAEVALRDGLIEYFKYPLGPPRSAGAVPDGAAAATASR
jgi:hypothetical protein